MSRAACARGNVRSSSAPAFAPSAPKATARWVAGILAWAPFALGAAPGSLPHPTDLRLEAREMIRDGKPLVVLFSQKGCSWCEKARAELVPRATGADTGDRALYRQIDLDSDTALTDFAGRPTTERGFAQADRVRFTPTLVVYGPAGEHLAEPIVGMRLPDFYGQYVDQAVEQARGRMKTQGIPDKP